MITLDASVWLAFLERSDRFHSSSELLFQWIAEKQIKFFIPEFALLEIGCALARRNRNPIIGISAAQTIAKIPQLELIPSSKTPTFLVLSEGAHALLRGSDAIYAYTAILTKTQLLTWDQELVERAGAITPSDWLEKQKQI